MSLYNMAYRVTWSLSFPFFFFSLTKQNKQKTSCQIIQSKPWTEHNTKNPLSHVLKI